MSYNGYKNYETWNVVLWISTDKIFAIYNVSRACANYDEFVDTMRELDSLETPDNVAWNDSGIDHEEVNNACFAEDVEDSEVDEPDLIG